MHTAHVKHLHVGMFEMQSSVRGYNYINVWTLSVEEREFQIHKDLFATTNCVIAPAIA